MGEGAQRWCNPTDLELVRTSPRKAARISGVVSGRATSKTSHQPGINSDSGSDADVVERTARFLRTLTQVTSRYKRRPDAVDSADLRHPDGYALRLRGVSTLAAAGQKN